MSAIAAPAGVRFEHRTDDGPVLGIGTAAPRLSWIVPAADPSFAQDAYEIEVTRGGGEPEVFRVASAEQVLVPWPAAPLASREAAQVRVRVSRAAGRASAWSEPATSRPGCSSRRTGRRASSARTRARWARRAGARARREPRRCPARSTSARLYATAHGVYEADAQRPARRRPRARARAGPATGTGCATRPTTSPTCSARAPTRSSVLLGNGWFRGRLGCGHRRALYGDRLALLAQLEVDDADGQVARARHRRVVDRARERDPRRRPLRRPADRSACRTARRRGLGAGGGRSTPTSAGWSRRTGPPVRVHGGPAGRRGHRLAVGRDARRLRPEPRRLGAAARARRRAGHGGHRPARRGARARRARHPAAAHGEGDRHATCSPAAATDVLRAALHLPRLPLRRGRRLAGRARRPTTSRPSSSHTDLRRTGWFDCSDELLNRLHENVVWGMRGNFLDVPTDCPQRDERLGWTGDIQVFAPTATFLYDAAGFLRSLARRPRRRAASPTASVPLRRPGRRCRTPATARPTGWGDAATSCRGCCTSAPATRRVLARQLDEHARLGRHDRRAGRRRTVCGPAASSSATGSTRPRRRTSPPRRRPTPTSSPPPTSRARPSSSPRRPRLLGDGRRRRDYARAGRARSAARSRASTSPPAGACSATPPTAYALALAWALLPTREQRDRAGERLAELVRDDRLPDRHRLRRHAAGHRRADRRRPRRRRLPPAAADGVPVLALPGDDGRDDGLGALGQHAARRHDQPRRDDLVQPLRARRGGRLAAPHRRRPRAGRAGLPADPRPAAADAPADPRERPPPDAVRGRRGGLGAGERGAGRARGRAGRRDGGRAAARRRGADRGGPRQPRVASARLVGRQRRRARTSPRSGRSWITSRPGSRSSPPRRTSRWCRGRPRPPTAEALPRRARGHDRGRARRRAASRSAARSCASGCPACWGSDAACRPAVRNDASEA